MGSSHPTFSSNGNDGIYQSAATLGIAGTGSGYMSTIRVGAAVSYDSTASRNSVSVDGNWSSLDGETALGDADNTAWVSSTLPGSSYGGNNANVTITAANPTLDASCPLQ